MHATFFVQGKGHIAKYPDVLRRISDEGHEIGNHTWNHRRPTGLDEDEVRWELTSTQDAIEKIIGVRPRPDVSTRGPATVFAAYRAAAAAVGVSDPGCHLPWELLAA
ncbi:polysaccharide deacetylase family protein, partial [Kitasatospora sp. NPDC085895]|uniref:polysaccharide deacetylase family protein n=1 Tax=Kitasatospora sp. NPDC085895 TaxID=3155057 RepID=UPI00344EF61A